MSATHVQTQTRYATSTLSVNSQQSKRSRRPSNDPSGDVKDDHDASNLSTRVTSLRASASASKDQLPSSPTAIQPFDGIEEAAPAPAPTPGEMSTAMRRKEQMYFAAVCTSLFVAGWNDASAGPLIPRMQDYYNIGYAVVSMIFVCNCVGFVSAALLNMWLNARFGFGIVITIGAASQVAAYCIQAAKPPFAVMALSYALNGFGEGLQDAQANGLVALLPTSPNTKMSVLHGIYGLGAFASPLVATQFSHLPERWSFHFLTSLGVGLVNLAAVIGVGKFKTQEVLLHEIGVQPHEEPASDGSMLRQVMSIRMVHLMAFFILVYVGAEVTIGGWIVTFLLHKRNAGHGAGYVSSGFFGGLTVGRMCLIWVNRKIGEQRVIYIYAAIAIALEFTIWFIPSLFENAIAVSFIGVVLGPMYPVAMNVTSVLLPRRVLTASIGWIASIGQTGSAAFPFILGVLAEKRGVQTLQPLVVAMLAFMLGVWFMIPSIQRHSD